MTRSATPLRPALAASHLLLAGCLLVAACTTGSPGAPGGSPVASGGPTAVAGSAAPPSGTPPTPTRTPIPEPTTTNTLPPPPKPTGPAPSTAGRLSARSLPVPRGWHRVVRAGGDEEGYEGNGTWVHGRDPRYAAHDVIGIGCAPVTRDDYPDPVAALEGTYEDAKGNPGIGLALDFRTTADAQLFFARYEAQVRACQARTEPVHTEILATPGGLIDRRTYPDGEWLEVVAQRDRRMTLIILGDPGHRISAAAARRILAQLP